MSKELKICKVCKELKAIHSMRITCGKVCANKYRLMTYKEKIENEK